MCSLSGTILAQAVLFLFNESGHLGNQANPEWSRLSIAFFLPRNHERVDPLKALGSKKDFVVRAL